MTTSLVKFQLRKDTSTNWNSVNPTLSPGEPGYETDTRILKIGNGSSTWTGLQPISASIYTDLLPSIGTASETRYSFSTRAWGWGRRIKPPIATVHAVEIYPTEILPDSAQGGRLRVYASPNSSTVGSVVSTSYTVDVVSWNSAAGSQNPLKFILQTPIPADGSTYYVFVYDTFGVAGVEDPTPGSPNGFLRYKMMINEDTTVIDQTRWYFLNNTVISPILSSFTTGQAPYFHLYTTNSYQTDFVSLLTTVNAISRIVGRTDILLPSTMYALKRNGEEYSLYNKNVITTNWYNIGSIDYDATPNYGEQLNECWRLLPNGTGAGAPVPTGTFSLTTTVRDYGWSTQLASTNTVSVVDPTLSQTAVRYLALGDSITRRCQYQQRIMSLNPIQYIPISSIAFSSPNVTVSVPINTITLFSVGQKIAISGATASANNINDVAISAVSATNGTFTIPNSSGVAQTNSVGNVVVYDSTKTAAIQSIAVSAGVVDITVLAGSFSLFTAGQGVTIFGATNTFNNVSATIVSVNSGTNTIRINNEAGVAQAGVAGYMVACPLTTSGTRMDTYQSALSSSMSMPNNQFATGYSNEGRGGWALTGSNGYYAANSTSPSNVGKSDGFDSPFMFPVGLTGAQYRGNTEFWKRARYVDLGNSGASYSQYDYQGYGRAAREGLPGTTYAYDVNGYPTSPTTGWRVYDPLLAAGSRWRTWNGTSWVADATQNYTWAFDYGKYLTRYSWAFTGGNPTHLSVLLGANDFTFNTTTEPVSFSSWIASFQAMVDNIHAADANVKVFIMIPSLMSTQDGAGDIYGAGTLAERARRNLQSATRAILTQFDTAAQATAKTYVSQFGGGIDPVFGSSMTSATSPNKYVADSNLYIRRATDGIHPNTAGMLQGGDWIAAAIQANR